MFLLTKRCRCQNDTSSPNTIRLSIGTEHIDDILADLEKGFAAAAALT